MSINILTKSITSIIILSGLITFAPSGASRDITVMSYNVQNGKGLDNQRNYQRTGKVISEHNPDFVGIQEVDSFTNRSKKAFVLEEIANSANMQFAFSPAINYDGGKYGIGMLFKEVPDSIKSFPLPGREEKRTLQAVYYNDLVVINTHFSLTPADAFSSVSIIADVIKTAQHRPVLLMGDLNSHPDSDVIEELTKLFTIISPLEAPTYPADSPNECIDYIMISKGTPVNVTHAEVIEEKIASDHRPLIVSFTLPD